MEIDSRRDIYLIRTGIRRAVEPGTGFPPLMPDTRANNLANVTMPNGEKIYVKAIAGQYTGKDGFHVLVLPEPADESMVQDIGDISKEHFHESLRVAAALAENALDESGIQEVNIGIHHAKKEWDVKIPKQKTKNFKNLHIQVMGAEFHNKPAITATDLRTKPEYAGKAGEPLQQVGDDLLVHEIIPNITKSGLDASKLFNMITDKYGRIRLQLKDGSKTFGKPELAEFVQKVDAEGEKLYKTLGRCYFETGADGEFIEEGEYKRYKLLPADERKNRTAAFIQERPWFSRRSQLTLGYLAENAQTAEAVINREIQMAQAAKGSELEETEKTKITARAANNFMAFKGFSHITIFSGTKNEIGGVEFTLGFRPSVFIIEGYVEAAKTYSVIEKHNEWPLTPEDLQKVQERERRVLKKAQQMVPELKDGPGLTNGI
jgi:hypothetical protein